MKIYPAPPKEFLSKLGEAAQDAHTAAPQDRAVYASQILKNPDFKSKGPVYRLNAWFSVVPPSHLRHSEWVSHWTGVAACRCPQRYCKCFTLWREWLRWLARAMLGLGRRNAEMVWHNKWLGGEKWQKKTRDGIVAIRSSRVLIWPQAWTLFLHLSHQIQHGSSTPWWASSSYFGCCHLIQDALRMLQRRFLLTVIPWAVLGRWKLM